MEQKDEKEKLYFSIQQKQEELENFFSFIKHNSLMLKAII